MIMGSCSHRPGDTSAGTASGHMTMVRHVGSITWLQSPLPARAAPHSASHSPAQPLVKCVKSRSRPETGTVPVQRNSLSLSVRQQNLTVDRTPSDTLNRSHPGRGEPPLAHPGDT